MVIHKNEMNDEDKALLEGILLGDGHIQKRIESYRYKIAQGVDQKEYLYWKYNRLKKFCTRTQGPKLYEDQKMYRFDLDSGIYLKELYHRFYKIQPEGNYKKVITQELIDSLSVNPILLAALFMDDGSIRNDVYSGKLATQGFSKEENQLLCDFMQSKHGIDCHVVTHIEIKNQYYTTIPVAGFPTLVSLIEPFVREIPDMCYKITRSNKPRND